ncbi:MAG: hypothetical protein IPM46_01590 [Flavobacteriales bacterium]|nr:hypothetical protein [Flavobacteriales bacterium]
MIRCIRPLLLIALATPATTICAQPPSKSADKVKVKARMAEKHKPEASMTPYRAVRSSATSYLVFRSPDFDARAFTKQSPRLDAYDRERLTYERSLEPLLERRGKERLLLEDLVVINRKPTLIARTGGREEVALYYQHIDPNLTRQPPAFDRLCAFPVEVKERQALYAKAGNATRERWSTVIAADSSHLLIHSPELRSASDDEAYYLLAMVDREMRVTWQHILRVSGGSDRSDVLSAAVDSAGTAYLVIKYRYKEGAPGGGAQDYEVVLHRIDADDMSRVAFSMDAGYYPTGGLLQPIGKGLAYAGIYANAGRKLGNFLAWVDTSETGLSQPMLYPFADGVDLEAEEVTGVEENKTEDDAKSGKKEQKRLHSTTDVIGLIPRKDGGYFIVNEVSFAAVYVNPETAKLYQRYYHGPVQARSIGKDGQVTWTTLFRRWATTTEPVIGRAFPVVFNDQLHVFLTDTDGAAELRKSGGKITPKQGSGGYTVYVYFDEKGVFRTKPVLRNDGKDGLIAGWELTRTGTDEYVAFGTNSAIEVEYLPVRLDFIKEVKK